MKNRICMFFMVLPTFVAAQVPNFSISGKIGVLNNPAKIYFDYAKNGVDVSDSIFLVNGTFRFSGYTPDITEIRLVLAKSNEGLKDAIVKAGEVIYLYVGKEHLLINSKNSLINADITGSKVNEDYVAYNKSIGGTMIDLTKKANDEWSSLDEQQQKDTSYIKAVDTRFHQSIARRTEKQLHFATDNPDSFFSLVAISEASENKDTLKRAQLVFAGLSARIRNSVTGLQLGSDIAQRISALSLTAVGKSAPLFTQNDVNGNAISLANLKGQIVLVDFWASWCHPCRGENPNLVKQYQLYKEKGFQIISVSLDNNKKNWVAAIANDGLTWLQVSDLKGWDNVVGHLYGIRAVPACFLIGKDGKIIANDLRGATLNSKLAEIFKD